MGSPRDLLVSFCAALALSCGAAGQPHAPPSRVTATSSSPEAVALFHEFEILSGNFRDAEGQEKLARAIALDPSFWLAHAWHGMATPTPEGLAEVQRAVAMSVRLPIAERLTIQRALAYRLGAIETCRKLARRIAELAPDDVQAQIGHGLDELVNHHYAPAAEAYRRATLLDPGSGAAFAGLATALAAGGAHGDALDAARRYLSIAPDEPNAYDTLGEIQLAAGQIEEASASFAKAFQMQPTFWVAMQGLAVARLHALDFRGARLAAEKARATVHGLDEKMKLGILLAYAALMEGSPEEAVAIAARLEREAVALGDPFWTAWAPMPSAGVLLETGHYAEALLAVERARSQQGALARHSDERGFAWLGLGIKVRALARLGRDAEAREAAQQIEAEARKTPGSVALRDLRQLSRGLIATLSGDLPGARDAFSACTVEAAQCRWELYAVQRRLGDHAGAEATRREITSNHGRDAVSAWAAFRAAREGGRLAPPL